MVTTNRLELVPHSPKHLLALFESCEAYEQSFGLPAAEGLRGFFVSDDVSPAWRASLSAGAEADPWVHGFALVHSDDRRVIGCAGFKGPPDADGVVEIGYGVVPSFQNRGLATEAVEALARYALASGRVRVVRAHTLPARNASCRVLEKCGFARTGEVTDPQDGLVWRWEKVMTEV